MCETLDVTIAHCSVLTPFKHSSEQQWHLNLCTPYFHRILYMSKNFKDLISWKGLFQQNFDCFHMRAKCVIWIIIWITQCTHERSNCDIWIMQCTHERPNLGFCIPAGECLGTLPIKHAHVCRAHISCASVHMQRAVYRRKWLEGHLAPPPTARSGHSYSDFAAWFARCVLNLKTPPDRHLKCAFQMTHCNVIWRTHGPK